MIRCLTTPVTEHHKILSLTVNGGFLQGARFDFSDGLNCIIGGRGTGKTTALELMRFALSRVPDKSSDKARHSQIRDLVKHNLGHGEIKLELETRDGTRYTIARSVDTPPVITDSNGRPVKFDISKDTIFGAELYSQSEIERIANSPQFQLDLIDKFAGEELHAVKREIREVVAALELNSRQIIEMSQRKRGLQDKLHELPDLKERLRSLILVRGEATSPLEDEHRNNASRLREREALVELIRSHEGASRKLAEFTASVESLLTRAQQIDPSHIEKSDILQSALEISKMTLALVTDSLRSALSAFSISASDLSDKSDQLQRQHAELNDAYKQLIAKHERDQKHGIERARIEKKLVELERIEKGVQEATEHEITLLAERKALRHRLILLRDRRFRYRVQAADYLTSRLGPAILVTVEQGGDQTSYLDLVRQALKGGRFHYNSISSDLVQRVPPAELARIVHERDTATLARDLDLDKERSEKVVSQLAAGQHIYRIETVEQHDQPSIKLNDGEYKDSTRLSTGQKCTVILPILLLKSERVLLVDQPEDNLDNAFIFDTVVKALRGCLGTRQMIFITHNPNIPVLGNAARVFCLHSTGMAASISSKGDVDEVAAEIIAVLEGGRAAFEERRERYGSAPPKEVSSESKELIS